jgi:hypothetical protein
MWRLAGSISSKTLWNIAGIVVVCVIVLAIGIFIGRTLTMNSPGSPAATAVPPDDTNVITLPSAHPSNVPTLYPVASATPTANPSTITPTPSATATATPTPTANPSASPTPTAMPTATPTPTATPYPTQEPQVTPTPTATPLPDDFIPDAPFYESITPIKDGDYLPPVSDQNSYDPGNGPVFIDLPNSNMGSPWAYPGDTLGIGLKLKNNGPAIDTIARVTMSLQKMVVTTNGQIMWIDTGITKQFSTRIAVGDNGVMQKNISYRIPTDIPYLEGTYKIHIKFYLHDQYSAGVIKVMTIM